MHPGVEEGVGISMRLIERRPSISWFWGITSLVLFGMAFYGLVSGEAILLPGRFSDGVIAYRVDEQSEFWSVIVGNLLLALGFALLAFFHSPYLTSKVADGRGRKPNKNFLIAISILSCLLVVLVMFGLYALF